MPSSTVAKPLSPKDHSLLTFIEQEYLVHGAVPTLEYTLEARVTDAAHYKRCLANVSFRHAMATRGISLRGLGGNPKEDNILTEEQLVAANIMLDLRDNRSQKKKLGDLGITSGKWEGWLRDPAFQSYLRTRAENLLPDSLHESHLALIDRVRSGDINAIKYYNEITGRYVPNGSDKADVNAVLMMVLEVIQRHVKDPVALTGISDDLVAIGRNMGGQANMAPRVIPGSAVKLLDSSPIDEDSL